MLGAWLTALIAVALVLDSIAVVSDVMERALLQSIAAGGAVSDAQVNTNDVRQLIIAGLQTVLYLATIPVFIVWFHRAHANLEPLGVQPRFSPGWAVGGWFIPFFNLVRPKQIANDIWRSTEPGALNRPLKQVRVSPLVHAWWASFLINGVIGVVYFQWPQDTVEQMIDSANTLIAADASAVVLDGLALLFVRRMTRQQDDAKQRRMDALLAAESQPPQPPADIG